MIKSLLISTNDILVSEIEEVDSQIGEPDCRLINPCIIQSATGDLVPWMEEVTNETKFMISSDKIITLSDPKPSILKKYTQKFS